MRTLGDMAWLNRYIGVPYVFGGRDMNGLDCYGLVKLIYLNHYGHVLPDWTTDVLNMRVRASEFENTVTSGDFTQKDEPEDGDLVICYRTKAAHHMGIYYAGGVIHCVDGIGTIYEPLPRFRRNYTNIIFGEWHPCP